VTLKIGGSQRKPLAAFIRNTGQKLAHFHEKLGRVESVITALRVLPTGGMIRGVYENPLPGPKSGLFHSWH